MTDEQRNQETRPKLETGKTVGGSGVVAAKLPPDCDVDVSTKSNPTASSELTAEEQMALYEQDLKENDWGHQPC